MQYAVGGEVIGQITAAIHFNTNCVRQLDNFINRTHHVISDGYYSSTRFSRP